MAERGRTPSKRARTAAEDGSTVFACVRGGASSTVVGMKSPALLTVEIQIAIRVVVYHRDRLTKATERLETLLAESTDPPNLKREPRRHAATIGSGKSS